MLSCCCHRGCAPFSSSCQIIAGVTTGVPAWDCRHRRSDLKALVYKEIYLLVMGFFCQWIFKLYVRDADVCMCVCARRSTSHRCVRVCVCLLAPLCWWGQELECRTAWVMTQCVFGCRQKAQWWDAVWHWEGREEGRYAANIEKSKVIERRDWRSRFIVCRLMYLSLCLSSSRYAWGFFLLLLGAFYCLY